MSTKVIIHSCRPSSPLPNVPLLPEKDFSSRLHSSYVSISVFQFLKGLIAGKYVFREELQWRNHAIPLLA